MIESNEDLSIAFGKIFETTFVEEILYHIPELPVGTTS